MNIIKKVRDDIGFIIDESRTRFDDCNPNRINTLKRVYDNKGDTVGPIIDSIDKSLRDVGIIKDNQE